MPDTASRVRSIATPVPVAAHRSQFARSAYPALHVFALQDLVEQGADPRALGSETPACEPHRH